MTQSAGMADPLSTELDRGTHREMGQFHDALVLTVAVDFSNRAATIALLAYPHVEARDRIACDLLFEDVSLFSSTLDLKEMERNAIAGTVVSIRLAESDQTTKIYLTGGAILIRSNKPKIVRHGEGA